MSYFAGPGRYFVGLIGAWACLAYSSAHAQNSIVPDNTLGGETSIVDSAGGTDLIRGGAVREQNLFHSFEAFNIGDGNEAYFLANPDTVNIFSRITGNDASEILGTLGTRQNGGVLPTSANLFLINPNGIVFGEDATLDMGGSFVATTASSILFDGSGTYSATDPQAPSSLLTVNPSAYWFNQANPASIRSTGALQVPDGASLTFLGGDILLDSSELTANGGRLALGAVRDTGTIEIAPDGNLVFSDDLARGDITLTNQAKVTTTSTDGGAIAVTADNLNILERSALQVGIAGGDGSGQSGDVTIDATGTVRLENQSLVANQVLAGGRGDGGDLRIQAENVQVMGGSQLVTALEGTGSGGNILLTADETVLFDGVGPTNTAPNQVLTFIPNQISNTIFKAEAIANSPSAAITGVQANARGDSGDINIKANNLDITNGSALIGSTLGQGDGSNILLTLRDTVHIDGSDAASGIPSGIGSEIGPAANGNGGNIEILAQNLTITNGARITSNSYGRGNAGNIISNIENTVLVDGISPNLLINPLNPQENTFAGSLINTGLFGVDATGRGGNIEITSNHLDIKNGGALDASNVGAQGNSGNISLIINDTLRIVGVTPTDVFPNDSFTDDFFPSNISSALRQAQGSGGTIDITANNLEISNGAAILVSALFGEGNAGNVVLTIGDTIRIDGIRPVIDSAGNLSPVPVGIFSQIFQQEKGESGNISVTAGNLELINGAQINTSTFSNGNAGDISLNISNTARLDGINPVNGLPSAVLSGTGPGARGSGGNVQITANSLELINGAQVSSSTLADNVFFAPGGGRPTPISLGGLDGGDVSLNINDLLLLRNGTIATISEAGSGGRINISADQIYLFEDSDIQTFVRSGAGNGGNLTIEADALIAFDDSDILAFSADGTGGNVDLSRTTFFGQNVQFSPPGTNPITLDNNNRVDINASGGITEGTITLPDDSFVDNNLAKLSNQFISVDTIIAGSCIATRNTGNNDSFIITGTGGLPSHPNDVNPTDFPATQVETIAQALEPIWQPGDPIVEPEELVSLENRTIILEKQCG